MRHPHEPRDEFIERLGGQITAELRRQNLLAQRSPWWTRRLLQSPLTAAIALALLVIASMGIGGVVVAAAYHAQASGQRDVLLAGYQQRAVMARQRVTMAYQQLHAAESRVEVGTGSLDAVVEARFKVADAEAQLKSIEAQLAEIQATGREPLDAVSSPLVSGRDFVTERWRIEMSVPVAALESERARLQSVQSRFDVGAATAMDVDAARTRVQEIEAAIEGYRKKIDIRQRFLKREMDAALANLRLLQAEAEQRRQTLAPRVEFARRTANALASRVEVGTAQVVELAEARMRVMELELEITKVNVDLAVIQRQLEQRKTGR